MAYPIVQDENASAWWKSWSQSDSPEEVPSPPLDDVRHEGHDIDWPIIIGRLMAELGELYSRVEIAPGNSDNDGVGVAGVDADVPDSLTNERFEATACVKIHKALPQDDALADPEFWIWMATHPGLELIRRRYPATARRPVPDRKNFTSSNARETFFYRLWVRAELAHDGGRVDPYELAEYGGIEFWRSHVFRQTSAEPSPMLAALIMFQHPEGPHGAKTLDEGPGGDLRVLVKYIRRAAANVVVEALDEAEARAFVEAQWRKIQDSRPSSEAAE